MHPVVRDIGRKPHQVAAIQHNLKLGRVAAELADVFYAVLLRNADDPSQEPIPQTDAKPMASCNRRLGWNVFGPNNRPHTSQPGRKRQEVSAMEARGVNVEHA